MVTWTRLAGSTAISALGIETGDGTGGEDDGGTFDGPVRIHVKFRHGRTYIYDLSHYSYYVRFLTVASKGRYYNSVIKKRFDYVSKY
ncbi:MAG: KTSC domain-containing protein [Planctomycetota bacterium]